MDPGAFRDEFRRGADLFNAHQWFECHDALETVWKKVKHEKKREPAQDPRRDFVHGILLIAVAYYHWSRDNADGVRKKLAEAHRLLDSYPARFEGVELADFLPAVFADLARGVRGEALDPSRVPLLAVG